MCTPQIYTLYMVYTTKNFVHNNGCTHVQTYNSNNISNTKSNTYRITVKFLNNPYLQTYMSPFIHVYHSITHPRFFYKDNFLSFTCRQFSLLYMYTCTIILCTYPRSVIQCTCVQKHDVHK